MQDDIKATFDAYPRKARQKLMALRKLILETAKKEGTGKVEETLKWGEPSYLVKGGSTVRIAWKAKNPDRYAIFFNCNTRLIETFRELYPDEFEYDGKRAIWFDLDQDPTSGPLKHCIALALTYHKVKHLELLGA